jgi:hypothetical protein
MGLIIPEEIADAAGISFLNILKAMPASKSIFPNEKAAKPPPTINIKIIFLNEW